MRTDLFDFELPEELIARQPLAERDASRLLHLPATGAPIDRMVRDLPALVRPGDLWVINDTRVIPARLNGMKASGGRVELLLIEALGGADWLAWGRANKGLKVGERIAIADDFSAEIVGRDGKEVRLRLHATDVAAAIEAHGHMPLPPYIDRPDTAADRERYQTVFARHAGAVAAPTAGLHLTEALLAAIAAEGASVVPVTLHVGPGTFQPVQVEEIADHPMHEEAFHIAPESAAAINAALLEGRRIVAVGTTALRTLESATRPEGGVAAGSGRTRIFIHPGYRFRVVGALLTNFHLPRSTLLMLVSALAGRERILDAYRHAIGESYRFYSYGDAMFVEAADGH